MARSALAPLPVAVWGLLAAVGCIESSDAAAPHVDEIPELAAFEELRIGSLDDPDAGFSQIRAVRVAESGEVYVLESSVPEVRVFSPDGERRRTLGRRGEGPGEFASPSDMGLLGDTLWVSDFQARRITWFGPDGEVLFISPAQWLPVDESPPGLGLFVFANKPRPDGLIESGLVRMILRGREIRPYDYPVLLFDREGEVVDTLRWERNDEDAVVVRVGDREGYAPALLPRPPLYEEMGDGRVVLDWGVHDGAGPGVLDIVRLGPGGDTLYHRSLGYEPRPVPSSVVDSLIEPRLTLAPSWGVSEREMARALREGMALPDHRPPIRLVHAARDGTLWVQLNTVSLEEADWLVLDETGTPVGRVTLPIATRIRHSGFPTVWAVETDDFDVPWLVRLRIE